MQFLKPWVFMNAIFIQKCFPNGLDTLLWSMGNSWHDNSSVCENKRVIFEYLQNSWKINSVICLIGFIVIKVKGSLSTCSMPLNSLILNSCRNIGRFLSVTCLMGFIVINFEGSCSNYFAWTVPRNILNKICHCKFSSLWIAAEFFPYLPCDLLEGSLWIASWLPLNFFTS